MKKRYRFLLTILLAGIAFWFLWPSVQWYFFTPQADKDVAESSRNQIKVYAQDKGDEIVKALVAMNGTDPLPADYEFLIAKARERYVSAKKAVPAAWRAVDVLSAYSARGDLAGDIEDHYRTRMFDLKNLKNKTLQLGLDLRGGMYITLQADFAELESSLNANLPEGQPKRTLTDKEKADKMTGALEALRNKIDTYGLTEPVINQQGADQIVIQIPGTQDREKVNSFIMGKGLLTFHIVDSDALAAVQEYQARTGSVLFDAAGNVKDPEALKLVPKGDKLLGIYKKDTYGLDELKGFAVVKEEVGLSGTEIQDASVAADPITGAPTVVFSLTSAGGDTFWKLTSANTKKLLCVVLDNKIKANSATIDGPIRDRVQVRGFALDEANDLALLLRTGSMPVPLTILSQEAVGASLGADTISQGIRASLLGLGLVFIFMLAFYRRAGFNAIIAQILNLYFIIAILSVFKFTLTLSAIAGLILNVGMAVDASVLIFERIKEEMRLGKSPQAVVKAGFDRALWAIADSNITTVIAAIVLSFLAKGSIKGFAMTLAIGNLSTLFTAVFISRLIFDFNVDVLKVKRIVISWRKTA